MAGYFTVTVSVSRRGIYPMKKLLFDVDVIKHFTHFTDNF